MDIKFKAGTFWRFQAIRSLSVGALDRSLVAGEVVEYDGLTLVVDGHRFAVPAFRAAIRAGWFEPLDEVEYQTTQVASPAVRQTVVAADDERYVRAATSTPKPVRSDATVRPVADSPSEGEVVGRVSTKAQQRFVISNTADAASAIREAENLSARRTPRLPLITEGADQNGVEVVADVSARKEEARQAAMARAAARKASLDTPAKPSADPLPAAAPVEAPAVDVPNSVLAAAQALSPGFSWDLKAHWKSRVKTALDRKSDHNFIAAVLMVESDTVRKAVVEGLKGA